MEKKSGDATDLVQRIIGEIDDLAPEMIGLRRELHRVPELGWCEFQTTARILELLKQWGIEPQIGRELFVDDLRHGVPDEKVLEKAFAAATESGISREILEPMRGGYTGAVVRIRGGQPGARVAFRADIDALPIIESPDRDHRPNIEGFASTCQGVMHACGHDGHTAMGLALARVIQQNRANWPGEAVIIFQPAEEGGRGARAMAAAGVVDDCDVMLTWHLANCKGRFGHVVGGASGFAMSKKFRVVFKGQAAHAGAEPHLGQNALLGAATATLNLHALPRHSGGDTRVNVGYLQALGSHNIVPGTAEMLFEVRSDEETVLEFLESRARQIVHAAADMHALKVEISTSDHTPSAVSDREVVDALQASCGELSEVSGFDDYFKDPGSDDATIFMRRVQDRGGIATYALIGAALASGAHTPRFDFEETALPIGVKLLALTAHRLALGFKRKQETVGGSSA